MWLPWKTKILGKVAINKWIQSRKKRDYAYIYQQTFGRKLLEKKSEIRRISWYKQKEQDYEGEDSGCYKEQCSNKNSQEFNMLVQLIQAGTQGKWGHETSSRYERGQPIHGPKTLQNGRNLYLTRSHSEERLCNFVRPQRGLQPCPSPSNISELTGNTMGTTYTYRGMPFGLNDAPRVFTQIMKKCVMAIQEIWKIRCVVYLDDLVLLHPDKNHLEKLAPQITQFLQHFG
jgi:hypothetical protein